MKTDKEIAEELAAQLIEKIFEFCTEEITPSETFRALETMIVDTLSKAREDERESCAKVCEYEGSFMSPDSGAKRCAEAIRNIGSE